jgi:hypothetical protein
VGWKKGIGRRRRRAEGRPPSKLADQPRRFSLTETGESFAVDDPVDLECPFCGANVVVSASPQAVMHGLPMCKKFEDEDPLVFLRNARLIIVGPLPDDAEYPVGPRQGGEEN